MKRIVVVTGAESGIGAACAAAFGAEGDRVAVCYYSDATAGEASAVAVRTAGGEAIIVQAHVNDEASVEAAFVIVEQAWGPADVLVNSAGLHMTA